MNLLALEAEDAEAVPDEAPDPKICMMSVAISASSVMLAPWPVPAERIRLGRLAAMVPYSFGSPVAAILKAGMLSDKLPATLPFIETVSFNEGISWSRLIMTVELPVAEMESPGMDKLKLPTIYPLAEMESSICGRMRVPHLAPVSADNSRADRFSERLISVGREAVAESEGLESRPVIIAPTMAESSMAGSLAPVLTVLMLVAPCASNRRVGRKVGIRGSV